SPAPTTGSGGSTAPPTDVVATTGTSESSPTWLLLVSTFIVAFAGLLTVVSRRTLREIRNR
ncbi:MAG: hypothetical protein ACXW0S_04835, partial [Solirubrobacterales bacterium]